MARRGDADNRSPCCEECFYDVARRMKARGGDNAFAIVEAKDAALKMGKALGKLDGGSEGLGGLWVDTLYKQARRGWICAIRPAAGHGNWLVLLNEFNMTVTPPRHCPHENRDMPAPPEKHLRAMGRAGVAHV